MKLKTADQFLEFVEQLQIKLAADSKEFQLVKEVVEEEKGSPELDISKPKIIDIDFDEEVEFEQYDLYSEEILKQVKSYCVTMMPQPGHTISTTSSDICLTVSIRNTGKINWPKGCKVVSLNTSPDTFKANPFNIKIGPNEEIKLDITVKNPGNSGQYTYIFSLADIKGRPFGIEFEFYFIVKPANSNSLFGQGFLNQPVTYNNPWNYTNSSYTPPTYTRDWNNTNYLQPTPNYNSWGQSTQQSNLFSNNDCKRF